MFQIFMHVILRVKDNTGNEKLGFYRGRIERSEQRAIPSVSCAVQHVLADFAHKGLQRGKSMDTIQLSDVQLINLSMLMTIRDNIKRDLVSACCKFGLHADQARFFGDLSIDRILAIVANIGQECLFPPREDLLALLSLPAPLTGPITLVHPPHTAVSSPLQGSPDRRTYLR